METLYLGIMLGMKLVQSLFVKRVSAGLSRPEDDLQYGFWSKMAAAAFALMILCLTGFTEPDLLTLLTAALMGLSFGGHPCSWRRCEAGDTLHDGWLCRVVPPIFAGAPGGKVGIRLAMDGHRRIASGWRQAAQENFELREDPPVACGFLVQRSDHGGAEIVQSVRGRGNASFNFWGFLISALALALSTRKAKRRGKGPLLPPAREHLLYRDSGAAGLIINKPPLRKDRTLHCPVYRGEWRRHRSCRVDGGGVF